MFKFEPISYTAGHEDATRLHGEKIERLKEEIDAGDKTIAEMHDMIADRDAEIARLRDSLDNVTKLHEVVIAKWREDLIKTVDAVGERDAEIARLKEQIAQLVQEGDDLAEMLYKKKPAR